MKNLKELDQFRAKHPFWPQTETSGAFKVMVNQRAFFVLASIDNTGEDGMWEHISVTPKNQKRCPTWDEMCAIKQMFFRPEEECVEFHPKESEYVNRNEYCLHIWRPSDGNLRDPTKAAKDPARTYLVTEVCPNCDSEVEMRWNTDTMGYKAFCPICGKRLMLCDECRHTEGMPGCDHDSKLDFCQNSPPAPAPQEIPAVLAVDTPLGALVVKTALDSQHPGVYVDLRRPGSECDMPLALIEFSNDDTDLPEGQPNIITRVWGNGEDESYTDRIAHQNIEEYFKTEGVEIDDRTKEQGI